MYEVRVRSVPCFLPNDLGLGEQAAYRGCDVVVVHLGWMFRNGASPLQFGEPFLQAGQLCEHALALVVRRRDLDL